MSRILTSFASVVVSLCVSYSSRAEQVEFRTRQVVDLFLYSFPGRVDFAGHGSKGQIAPNALPKLHSDLDSLVIQMNAKYRIGKWLAMYGGDSYNPEKPDIAHALMCLKERHRITVFAAQSAIVKQWGGVEKHVDFVYYVRTGCEPKANEAGQPVIENGSVKQQVIWGGGRNMHSLV